MTITIDVPEAVAEKIAAEAARQGQDASEIVRHLIERRFAGRSLRRYDPAAFIAALDSFEEGGPDEQRSILEYLKMAIDRDRPGQRSIFGEGINPMVPMDEIG